MGYGCGGCKRGMVKIWSDLEHICVFLPHGYAHPQVIRSMIGNERYDR